MLRYKKTLKFLNKHVSASTILDLGDDSELADLMRKEGHTVDNTTTDLDVDFARLNDYEIVTAFEVLEHLFAPFNLLNNTSGIMIISVPLKVWFSSAYWSKHDKLDRHYHEFEKKQFDALLERTEWTIIDSEVWTSPDKLRLGIRPLLRFIYPSYYILKIIKKKTI